MYGRKFYLYTWFICLCFCFWWLILPIPLGIFLLIKQHEANKQIQRRLKQENPFTVFKDDPQELAAYKTHRVEQYEFMATLDKHTCPTCGALDGQHFLTKDAVVGENFPPMHDGCRCTTVEYDPYEILDYVESDEEPPERTTYTEWKRQRRPRSREVD